MKEVETVGACERSSPCSFKRRRKPLEFRQIVRDPVNPGRSRGVLREHGDGDGLLVHIHSEIDGTARHGLVFQ